VYNHPIKEATVENSASHLAVIDARPDPITIDTLHSALLVIDMQNDFGSRGGMFDRAGIDISGIRQAIAPTKKAIAAAHETGIPIIYVKMGFLPDLSNAGPPDSPNRVKHVRIHAGKTVQAPDGSESRILIRDTWNTDIVGELAPEPGDIVMYKHRFSAFFETELDEILTRLNARYLIFTGCTTSVCVESTIRDAMFRNYSCVLLEDCTAEPIGNGLPRSNHEASLLVLQTLFAWISRSEKLIEALEARAAAVAGPA
jgi:ureidoacrylate peracid hydrolase